MRRITIYLLLGILCLLALTGCRSRTTPPADTTAETRPPSVTDAPDTESDTTAPPAEERPEDYNNIRIPNGVYTFNPNNDGKAGTFLESYSLYKEYDINGYQVDEKAFSEGTLTITDDMIKLEVVFDGETDLYILTYEGDYAMMDKRSESGAIF